MENWQDRTQLLIGEQGIEKLKNSMEIIFVDGGSTDNTKELIGRNFRIVSSEKGRANQMNYGASVSKGDIVLFLHFAHADERYTKHGCSFSYSSVSRSAAGAT